MGLGIKKNNHCDSVSMEIAFDLMSRLQIRQKQEFAELCGVNKQQFSNWMKKGRMPIYRLAILRESVHLNAKKKYDEILKVLYE